MTKFQAQNKYGKNFLKMAMTSTLMIGTLTACDHSGGSFSLLGASQNFSQGTAVVNNKIDILWVIDNSTSMQPLQTNLVNNFNSFINNFQSKGYDFKIAVTTSDAYLAAASFDNDPSRAQFKDGTSANGYTGVFVIDPMTPNLISTFVTNANQGQTGSGDERVFSSFKEALNSSLNVGFLRPTSHLSVIILSDEDDFSDPNRPEGSWASGGTADHDYNDPGLESVASYVSYLDQLTNSTGASRRYDVSAITVLDSTCLASHQQDASSSIIGQRYIQMANSTGGVLGSICDSSYATALGNIQQNIIELSTQFALSRQPVVSSIIVLVNNQSLAQDAQNGWTYSSDNNSITFHGNGVPPQGASIQVSFDPTTAQN